MTDQGPHGPGQPYHSPPASGAAPVQDPAAAQATGGLPGSAGLDLDEIDFRKPGRKPGKPMSSKVAGVIGLVAGVAIGSGVSFAAGATRSQPQPAASASAVASAAPSASAIEAASPSPLEAVIQGEPEAVKRLEARTRDQRTAAETTALARARPAVARRELAELKRKIELVPKFAKEPQAYKKLRAHAKDSAVALEVFDMLASLDGSVGPDLLYKLSRDQWGLRNKETRQLAADLLYATDLRKKASSALSVVLDLNAAQECKEAAVALKAAVAKGDRRVQKALGRFYKKRGCGANEMVDCWPCLRNNDLIKEAGAAVRRRKAPL